MEVCQSQAGFTGGLLGTSATAESIHRFDSSKPFLILSL